ncbi:MAG: ATP-binding protein [Methanosarcinaceae archaeon]|nr:ATP-binding protein [Methanosarcinaceae archaeon]
MITMPFTLKPAKAEEFVNREELLEEMLSELSDSDSTVGYALYGRRRVGKTSVLKEIQRKLEESHGCVVVYFSVWGLIEYSVEEFCRKLSLEILEAYRKELGLKFRARELMEMPLSLLGKILEETELRVVYGEFEFLLSRKTPDDSGLLLEHCFGLSEKLAKATGRKCVLLLDEFPSVIDLKIENKKVGEGILKKIRTIFEDWEKTTLCISGSVRSTMDLTVLSAGSPFYRQLVAKEVKPLGIEHVRKLLRQNLKIPDESVEELYSFSAGIPFYVHFLGRMLERKSEKTPEVVRAMEKEFLAEEGNLLFREEFNSLGAGEKAIVMEIALGRNSPKEISASLGARVSNVNTFLNYLINKGYVARKEKGVYSLEDPVFGRWVREILVGGENWGE